MYTLPLYHMISEKIYAGRDDVGYVENLIRVVISRKIYVKITQQIYLAIQYQINDQL